MRTAWHGIQEEICSCSQVGGRARGWRSQDRTSSMNMLNQDTRTQVSNEWGHQENQQRKNGDGGMGLGA